MTQQPVALPNYSDHKNSNYNIAIDNSGSMGWEMGKKNTRVRYKACQEAAVEIADDATSYDPDGIRVYTFAGEHKWTRTDNVIGDKVADIFEENKPRGKTYAQEFLRDCFMDYLKRRNEAEGKGKTVPGERLIIFTDGQANDQNGVALEIATFTHQLRHKHEFRIGFVIVLEKDDESKEYQEVVDYVQFLDDSLKTKGIKDANGNRIKAKYDIIDCKSLEWVEDHSSERFFQELMND